MNIPNELVSIILNKIDPQIILDTCEFNEEILDMILYSKIGLNFSGIKISDYDLMLLEGIETINCSGSLSNKQYNITDQGVMALSGIKKIDLSNCPKITNECFDALNKAEHVKLINCNQITDIGIGKLVNLKTLNITFCERITDNGVISLKNLDLLAFSSQYITEKSLEILCPKTEWNLKGTLTGGIQCMAITNMAISITDSHISNENFYKAISGLKFIGFHFCTIDENFVEYLSKVKLLLFFNCKITVQCIEKLKNIEEIILVLCDAFITDKIKGQNNVKIINLFSDEYNQNIDLITLNESILY
jgi:hypothetical protein